MRHIETPAGKVHSLRFWPDGGSLYFLSDEPARQHRAHYQHAFRFSAVTGEVTGGWPFAECNAAVFSPDMRSVYSAGSKDWNCLLRRFDLSTGKETELLRTGDVYVWGLAFTPNHHLLALSGLNRRTVPHDYCVWCFNVLYGTLLEPIRTLANCLEYSPDGRLLAVGGQLRDGSLPSEIRIWAGSKQLVEEFAEPARHLAWSTDGRLAWGMGGQLNVARPGTGEPVRTWSGSPGVLSALAFSPDSRLLLTGTDGSVCALHDPTAGRVCASFDWGIGPIHSVAFSPDGLTCAAGGEKGQVVVWDVDA